MKKLQKLLGTVVLIIMMIVAMGSSVHAGGTKEVRNIPLADSGLGGTTYTSQYVNSGLYYEACGSVNYSLQHNVNYGKYNSSSFTFNSTGYKVTSLNKTLKGGVGFISNYESTAYNKYDYKANGSQLYYGSTVTYYWNSTMALGNNANAHYDVTTISGFANDDFLCNNEFNIVMNVGGRSLASTQDQQEVPAEFNKNVDNLEVSLGEEYSVSEELKAKDVVMNNFSNDSATYTLTQQKDNPIDIVNVHSFIEHIANGNVYEIGNFENIEGTKFNVVKFSKDDVFMSLVSEQSVEDIISHAEGL